MNEGTRAISDAGDCHPDLLHSRLPPIVWSPSVDPEGLNRNVPIKHGFPDDANLWGFANPHAPHQPVSRALRERTNCWIATGLRENIALRDVASFDDQPSARSCSMMDLFRPLLCFLGFHDFRVVEVTVGFGASGAVEKVECRRCGRSTTRRQRDS